METLLFTGFSAAGKSTIARRLSKDYGFLLLEERAILHELAIAQGFNRTREWIREEGEELVLQAARIGTILKMKELSGGMGVVVDGSYDRHLPLTLRITFPDSRVTVVCVTIEDQEREIRMRSRLGTTIDLARQEMELIDGFKLRAGVEDVIKAADITIKNDASVEDSLRKVALELESRGIVRFLGKGYKS